MFLTCFVQRISIPLRIAQVQISLDLDNKQDFYAWQILESYNMYSVIYNINVM